MRLEGICLCNLHINIWHQSQAEQGKGIYYRHAPVLIQSTFSSRVLKKLSGHHCFSVRGPHFFPCVRLPGHQFGTGLCWISILCMRGKLHSSSSAAFLYCSNKGDAPSGCLWPLTFLHSLLKTRLSLFFNYQYVIRCVLPRACESCWRTAWQITRCASLWTGTALCSVPVSAFSTRILIQNRHPCCFIGIGKLLI